MACAGNACANVRNNRGKSEKPGGITFQLEYAKLRGNCSLSPCPTFGRGAINFTGHLLLTISLNVTETHGKVARFMAHEDPGSAIHFFPTSRALLNGNGELRLRFMDGGYTSRVPKFRFYGRGGLSFATGNGLQSALLVHCRRSRRPLAPLSLSHRHRATEQQYPKERNVNHLGHFQHAPPTTRTISSHERVRREKEIIRIQRNVSPITDSTLPIKATATAAAEKLTASLEPSDS